MSKLQELLSKVAKEEKEEKYPELEHYPMPSTKSPEFWEEPSASRDAVFGALAGVPVGALIDYLYGHDSVGDGALTGAVLGAGAGAVRGSLGESTNERLRKQLELLENELEDQDGWVFDDDEQIGRLEERRHNILEDLWR